MAKDPLRGKVVERPEPDTKSPGRRIVFSDEVEPASRPVQLNAGTQKDGVRKIWHTDSNGEYWMGNLYHRTPKQLLRECLSTIRDLLINHPGIEDEGA